MPRANRPISVILGELQSGVEAAIDEWLRQRVDEAFADPPPNVPLASCSSVSIPITPGA